MAWLTDAELKISLAARLALANVSAVESAHWDVLITEANEYARNLIKEVIVYNGLSASDAESWDRAQEFQRKLAVCYLFRHAHLKRDEGTPTLDAVCKCEEDIWLATILVDGELAESAGGSVGFGRLSDADDTFTLETRF